MNNSKAAHLQNGPNWTRIWSPYICGSSQKALTASDGCELLWYMWISLVIHFEQNCASSSRGCCRLSAWFTRRIYQDSLLLWGWLHKVNNSTVLAIWRKLPLQWTYNFTTVLFKLLVATEELTSWLHSSFAVAGACENQITKKSE